FLEKTQMRLAQDQSGAAAGGEGARHLQRLGEKGEPGHGALEMEAHIEVAAVVAFPGVDAALIEQSRRNGRMAHAAWHVEQRPLASIMVRWMAKPSRLAASARSTRAWPASNSSAAPHFSQMRKMVERAQAPMPQATKALRLSMRWARPMRTRKSSAR